MQWLRRLVRRNTKPIPQPIAHVWKRRMALAYGFLAWNALAVIIKLMTKVIFPYVYLFQVVVYAVYNGKRDWAEYHGLETTKLSPGKYLSTLTIACQ
jgi:hypothetical protein